MSSFLTCKARIMYLYMWSNAAMVSGWLPLKNMGFPIYAFLGILGLPLMTRWDYMSSVSVAALKAFHLPLACDFL